MPAFERKRVTLTLTADVEGSGRAEDFIGLVAGRVRQYTAGTWSLDDKSLTAGNVTLTEVHLEAR